MRRWSGGVGFSTIFHISTNSSITRCVLHLGSDLRRPSACLAITTRQDLIGIRHVVLFYGFLIGVVISKPGKHVPEVQRTRLGDLHYRAVGVICRASLPTIPSGSRGCMNPNDDQATRGSQGAVNGRSVAVSQLHQICSCLMPPASREADAEAVPSRTAGLVCKCLRPRIWTIPVCVIDRFFWRRQLPMSRGSLSEWAH